MSSPTLADVMTEMGNDLRTIPGLRRCFDVPPDQIGERPAIVMYPISGSHRLASHSGDLGLPMRWMKHTIVIRLMVARKDLSRDYESVMAFCDTLPNYLFAGFKRDAYGGSMTILGDPDMANNAINPIRYSLEESGWGSDQTLEWRYEIDVSINAEINV